MRKNLPQSVFLLFIVFAVLALWAAPLAAPREISVTENRALAKFPELTIGRVTDGTFQTELEAAVGDHLFLSESMRSWVKDAQAAVLNQAHQVLYALNPALKSGYTQIAEGYYAYQGDAHRIVEKPRDVSAAEGRLKDFASGINRAESVKKYLYFIENSRSVNFDAPDQGPKLYDWVRSFFVLDGSADFSWDGYEDYCRWFYQTDHHWNQEGAYRGYKEIMALLGRDGGLIPTGELVTFPVVFNGSYARITKSLCADESFAAYTFPSLPKHAISINGKRSNYGRLNSYLKGKYNTDSLTNHYSVCFGGEFAEIQYDFGTTGKGNLLLIASSYSNPINALIASHFDQTWVIDPRYYEETAGAAFDPPSYVREHHIDTLLLLGDIEMFTGDLPEGEGVN